MGTPDNEAARILVIDDDPFVVDSVRWILEPVGYDIHRAESAKDGLALLEKLEFDLVLTDYSMPEMRGDELAATIRERHPGLPVLVMTAYGEMLECSLTPVIGVMAVITKPFLAGGLRETVARFIVKRRTPPS